VTKIIKTERGLRKLLRSIKLMVQVFICSANVPSCRDVVTDVLLLSHCVIGLLAYISALYICIAVTNRYGTGRRREAHGLVCAWYRNAFVHACMTVLYDSPLIGYRDNSPLIGHAQGRI